jgi:hypothetical protein
VHGGRVSGDHHAGVRAVDEQQQRIGQVSGPAESGFGGKPGQRVAQPSLVRRDHRAGRMGRVGEFHRGVGERAAAESVPAVPGSQPIEHRQQPFSPSLRGLAEKGRQSLLTAHPALIQYGGYQLLLGPELRIQLSSPTDKY